MKEGIRKSGIDIIGDVPWGTHFCQFYQTKEDVIEILVPYFKAGLENNEFCLCVLSQPFEVEDAKEALRRAIPDLNTYQEKGQFEIVPFQGEFITRGIFDSEKAYSYWVEILNHSLDSGHDGLRFGGIISRTDKEDWNLLLEYEKQIGNVIDNYQMMALCTYSLNRCSATEIIDVVANHQFALIKKEGEWERIDYSGRKNINERKKTAESLSQSEQRFRLKSEEPFLPSLEIANLELADIVDVQAIQSLMDDFYNLVHIPIGLNDFKGNVLAGAGWQDICTRFHRIHPEAFKHCIESAIMFSPGVPLGEFKLYKCKNNMWDVAAPIMVGGRQAGVIFLGQFFFEDDLLDYESFKSQARQYGFNEEEYLAALEKVPRLSRENVEKSTTFLTKLANIISQQSYSNIKLARSLAERDALLEALRSSESKYMQIMETAQEGVWIIDRNDQTVFVNQRFSEMLGYSIDEIMGQKPQKFLSFEFRTVADDRLREHRQRVRQAIDYRFIKKDGSDLWCIVSTHQLFDGEGKYAGSLGMLTDITERKKAEEMLQVSEARYRSLYENSLDGILLTKPDGTILSANPEACHMFGMTEDEIKQVGREGVVVNDEKLATALEERKQTGRMRAELTHKRKDGSTFVCDTTSQLFIDTDGSTSTSLIIRDVTERKRAEEALRQSEKRCRTLFESLRDAFVQVSMDGRIIEFNDLFHKMLGYSPDEIRTLTYQEITPESWHAFEDCIVREQIIPRGYSDVYEKEYRRKDGTIIPVELRTILSRDGSGYPESMWAIVRDTTERKRAEKEVQGTKNMLQLIMNNIPQGIFWKDRNSRYMGCNKVFAKAAGLESPESIVGKTDYELPWLPKQTRWFREYDRKVMENNTPEYHIVEPQQEAEGKLAWIETNKIPLHDAKGNVIGILGTYEDITERMRAERALQESEEKFRDLVEHVNDWVWEIDTDCVYTYASPRARELLGYDPADLLGTTPFDYMTSEEADRARSLFYPIFNEREEFFLLENTLIRKDGGTVTVETSGVPIYNSQGNFSGYRGIDRDITGRKKAEEALRLSNLYNRSLIEASLDPLVTIGHDGKITDVNGATEQVTGYSRNELVGTDFSDYFTEPEKARKGYQQVFTEGEVRDYSLDIQHKEGHITPVLYNASVYRDENGKIIGVFAAARDITESIKAEEKIKTLANAVESSDDAIVTKSLDGIITSWNKGAEKVYGYSAEEVVGKPVSILEPDGRKGEIKLFSEKINQGEKVQHYETTRLKKDGTIISVSITLSPIFDSSGKLVAISTIARDITERKRADEALRLSNLYNRSLIEASLDPLVTIGPDGKITDVNAATEIATGYSRGELIGTDFSDYFTDPEKAKKGYQQVFKEGSVFDYELEIQNRNGSIIPVLYNASVYKDESGKVTGVFAAARDISERKRAEDVIKTAAINLARAERLASLGHWEWDLTTNQVKWSDGHFTIFGYPMAHGTETYEIFRARVHPDDIEDLERVLREGMEKDTSYKWDYRLIFPDGSLRYIHAEADRPVKDTSGNPVRWFGTVQDITERRKVEEALKKANDRLEEKVKERTAELEKAYKSLKEGEKGLAEAQRMAHIGNWDWDLLTGRMRWSNELYNIFGRSPLKSAPLINELLNYVHPEDRDYVGKSIEKGLKEESKNGIDYRIILANGEERTVHSQAEVIFDRQNTPVRVKGIVQDITERKKAEEKIKILANAVESSNDAITTLSLEGIVTSWNKGAKQIYGYSAEEIVGKNISITEPNSLKGEIKYFSEKIKQGEKSQSYETLRLKKDGTTINISAALSPVFNASGELVAILAIARDITERIETEEAMAEIDKIRIKEIHHRIKNNLQVISSLLDLQAERFRNKEVLEAFRESQNRVTSMSLIHEELYKSEGKDTLNFSAYLQKLAESLFQTYSLSSKNVCLCMDLEENTFFDMDIAVPLGIIVNELVSNSLKHAFAEGEEGEIQVRLCREEENDEMHSSIFSLTISDNGKGIPENIDLESLESLGLQLVNALVDQLDGKMEIKRKKGAEFRITFKVAEK